MNLVINHEGNERVYILTIDKFDYVKAEIDPWMKELIKECDSSNLISDKLLALQVVARAIESSQPKEKSKL